MTLEVLLSCMQADDVSLIEKMGLKTDAVVVNQCGMDAYKEYLYNNKNVRICYSTLKGLSKSRNLAIEKATADVCLLCDDDEVLRADYENGILGAFLECPSADVIVFKVGNLNKKYQKNIHKLNFIDIFKVSSVQIAFRRENIIKNEILFDEKLGSGSGNGAEEELKFLLDCKRKKLKIYYYPLEIATLTESESTWFDGFNYQFFYQRGRTTRYILGYVLAELYAFYYLICKHGMYKTDISIWKAFEAIQKGLHSEKIG